MICVFLSDIFLCGKHAERRRNTGGMGLINWVRHAPPPRSENVRIY